MSNIAMDSTCANCHHHIDGNFCSNCGQKKFKRIDRKYISDELQYTLLHTNKGFFYSVKNIARNPGKTARDFVDGNRVNHYKPILLVLLLSGISAFISYKILGMDAIMRTYYDEKGIDSSIITYIVTYNSAFMMALVPFFATMTKIIFWKWGHNYFEHVVMNAFILAYYTIFNIVIVYPLLYLVRHDPHTFIAVTMGSMMLIMPVLLVGFFKTFYPEKKLKHVILRVLLMLLLLALLYVLIIIIAVIAIAVLNPELIRNMKPQ